MKKLSLYMLAGLALFTACGSDNEGQSEAEKTSIKLTTNILTTTRATGDIQNTQYDNSERVNVFIDEIVPPGGSVSTTYVHPLKFVADGAGNLSPSTGIYPYFPLSGTNVRIYATYPAVTPGSNVDSTATSFTVKSNQTSLANYRYSDLMYSCVASQAKTTSAVNLTFKHKLTRIIVELQRDASISSSNFNGSKIILWNVIPTINFTKPSTGAMTSTGGGLMGTATTDFDNGAGGTYSTTQITVTDSYDGLGDGHDRDAGVDLYAAAIIPPQEITAGTRFLEIYFSDGTSLYYNMPTGIVFKEGFSYTFIIKVKKTMLDVTWELEDWNTDATAPNTDGINSAHIDNL